MSLKDFSTNPAFVDQFRQLFATDPCGAVRWLRDAGGYLPSTLVKGMSSRLQALDRAAHEGRADDPVSAAIFIISNPGDRDRARIGDERLRVEQEALQMTRELESGNTSPLAGRDRFEQRQIILSGSSGLTSRDARDRLEALGFEDDALVFARYNVGAIHAEEAFAARTAGLNDVERQAATEREKAIARLDARHLLDRHGRHAYPEEYARAREAIDDQFHSTIDAAGARVQQENARDASAAFVSGLVGGTPRY
jgi:hypothetical protein